jgi:hypothetical protein
MNNYCLAGELFLFLTGLLCVIVGLSKFARSKEKNISSLRHFSFLALLVFLILLVPILNVLYLDKLFFKLDDDDMLFNFDYIYRVAVICHVIGPLIASALSIIIIPKTHKWKWLIVIGAVCIALAPLMQLLS